MQLIIRGISELLIAMPRSSDQRAAGFIQRQLGSLFLLRCLHEMLMVQSCPPPGTASVAPRPLSSAVCFGPVPEFPKLSLLWSMVGSRKGFLACQSDVRACETPEAVDAACCSSKTLAEACAWLSHSGLCPATRRARRRALARAHLGAQRGGRFCKELEQSEWVDTALLKLCS